MTEAALIEQIVRKVLAGIRESASLESFSSCFLILGTRENTDMEKLTAHLPTGAATVFTEDRPGLQVMDPVHQPSREYEGIILPSLSMTAMADLALGRATEKTGHNVLELLMSGYQVKVMDFEYTAFREAAPPALWQLYESYRKTLEGFGLTQLAPPAKGALTVQKKLVTEQEIQRLHQQGVSRARIAERTIVTSLAKDLADALGIEIQRF
ncbi:MAG: hypothetical protein HUN04_11750 [Desulfobacter sp.]|nr:MAG: hypothetical protein HUN04_11750 [Desulfobacter sp.]